MTRCCIVGCGPAGAILGLLLARAGVDVLLLEKHADFLRDFRGDTIHPSTLEILNDLGLADRFLAAQHNRVSQLVARLASGEPVRMDFSTLPTRFPYVAFVPQWDFLKFVTDAARGYPSFHLEMEAEAVDLLRSPDGRIDGVRYTTPHGTREVHAQLTVGTDGRTSRVREAAGLELVETSPPMDVLWLRVSRRPSDPSTIELRLKTGHFVALINRDAYWQIAYVIPKGALDAVHKAGLGAFRQSLAESAPEIADRVSEVTDWDQAKLLNVRADRLRRWYAPGVLCIGDAAHAMSPIGGVGINVAIQDAVEAANLLWKPLRAGHVDERHLARVQRRRELAVVLTQGMQNLLQERILRPTLHDAAPPRLPALARLGLALPFTRNLPAHLVGLGVRRPHVRVPELAAPDTA
jgi:2-polyprenyl-6-methoxyphenol hydroxylase-like FAD-dependent oxidoreductase